MVLAKARLAANGCGIQSNTTSAPTACSRSTSSWWSAPTAPMARS